MKVSIERENLILSSSFLLGISDSQDSTPQDQHDNVDDEKAQNHVWLSHTRRRVRLAGLARAVSPVPGLHRTLVWRRSHTQILGAVERTLHTQVSTNRTLSLPDDPCHQSICFPFCSPATSSTFRFQLCGRWCWARTIAKWSRDTNSAYRSTKS
jgi:hypothetical protein